MKINITFKLNDKERKAIANYYSDKEKADYKTCRNFIESATEAEIQIALYDLNKAQEKEGGE